MKVGIIILLVVAAISAIIGLNQYWAEETRQQGFIFGNELQQIQQDVRDLQTKFYADIDIWEEGQISRTELQERLQFHVDEFHDVLTRYDTLEPPDGFAGAVELFRLSSQAQLESDEQYILWITTSDESAKTRSDLQLKESFDLEMSALAEYNQAKGP
ncbi:MAG: hypothetical protein F4Y18_05875 [Cenarchaeum sp. SB0663_bin_5]|nr:hypothetical protein [Cenarchaeum sp. SB0663_bin_5]MYH03824.1 hypothetical protein [Cenarchaeum sp. SB0675_bin_21]MYL11172.1 hypothetical protein [Cenarchaeum sp. SB0669_bin_11]